MIDAQRITIPIDLGRYAEPYKGQRIEVWVNLSIGMRQTRARVLRALGAALVSVSKTSLKNRLKMLLLEWQANWLLAQVWSAGETRSRHWTAFEVAKLKRIDPALYLWAGRETWRIVDEWDEERKKKL